MVVTMDMTSIARFLAFSLCVLHIFDVQLFGRTLIKRLGCMAAF